MAIQDRRSSGLDPLDPTLHSVRRHLEKFEIVPH